MRFYEGALQRLDTNRNGMLDPEEVGDGWRRGFAERMVRGAGLEPKFPVSLDALRKGLKKQSQSGGADSSGAGSTLVPGFGVQTKLPNPPGFGKPDERQSSSQARSSSRSGLRNSSSSSSGSSDNHSRHRLREYAKSLLRRYDENESGSLEEGEWRKMSRSHWAADRNGDKVITVDELTDWLEKYSRQGSHRGSSNSRGSSDSGKHRTYRFLTPTERLSDELPDWFVLKDAEGDGDGQVAMYEYASNWTDAKAAAFVSYDLNNDGMITPAECLAVENQE